MSDAHFSLRLRHTELAPSFVRQNNERKKTITTHKEYKQKQNTTTEKKNLKSHIWVLFSLPNTRNDHFFFIACGSIYRTDFVFFLCRFCFFFGLWFNILTFFVIVIIYMHAWVCMFFFCYEKKLYVQKKLRSIEMGRNKKKIVFAIAFASIESQLE